MSFFMLLIVIAIFLKVTGAITLPWLSFLSGIAAFVIGSIVVLFVGAAFLTWWEDED